MSFTSSASTAVSCGSRDGFSDASVLWFDKSTLVITARTLSPSAYSSRALATSWSAHSSFITTAFRPFCRRINIPQSYILNTVASTTMPSCNVLVVTTCSPVIADFYASAHAPTPTRSERSQHRFSAFTLSTRPVTNCPGWNTFVGSLMNLSAASRSATKPLKS